MSILSGNQDLSELLDLLSEELDIPEEKQAKAKREYDRLGKWLEADHVERYRANASIYPQGSTKLGTAVMPISTDSDYDVDLVYRREIGKTSTTQQNLMDQLGEQLAAFVAASHGEALETPSATPGRRCWTLEYPSQFHMDVLPAIPDDDSDSDDAILIPDRDLVEWQMSNPRGYAAWFAQCEQAVFELRLQEMAKTAQVDVEEFPQERVRTPLRQAVRLLKRHRDLWSLDRSGHKPTSIILTTLAALAYSGEGTTGAAFVRIVNALEEGIEIRHGEYWIPNPANLGENFADKWGGDPARADEFFAWTRALRADVEDATSRPGIQRVADALSPLFGVEAVRSAAIAFGKRRLAERESGRLRMRAGSGNVGSTGRVKVQEHTNYGEDW